MQKSLLQQLSETEERIRQYLCPEPGETKSQEETREAILRGLQKQAKEIREKMQENREASKASRVDVPHEFRYA